MKNNIYKNKEAAQVALDEIEKDFNKLLDQRGASLYSDSECHGMELSVRYINEKGHEDYLSKYIDTL
jgi:hypothetical protein